MLWRAVRKGDIIEVKDLTQKINVKELGKILAHQYVGGGTLLHYAVLSGSLEIVQHLVEIGAKVNAKDGWGGTALHWACAKGHFAVAEYLLQIGGKKCMNEIHRLNNHTPLTIACYRGHTSVVKILLKYEVDVMKPGRRNKTALEWSIVGRNYKIVSILRKELREPQKSKKYETKFQTLLKMPREKITKVSLVIVKHCTIVVKNLSMLS